MNVAATARSPREARALFRTGAGATTAGRAPGYAQANLLPVPADRAYEVLLFCRRNPKPCPVLDVTGAGSWTTLLAPGADLRTDLPGYRVRRDGELVGDPAGLGIMDLGRPDFGDPVEAQPGDVPVFRACGVTRQAAVTASRPPFAITHAPGRMFITDARDEQFRVA
ncbi:D-glutamate cyclase family protein [Streptomyces altiplanensis]